MNFELKEVKLCLSLGSLAEYANPDLREQEKTAWEKAVKEKYDNERYVRVLNSMAGL